VEFYLQEIEEKKHLNAYITVFKESALEQAMKLDAALNPPG